MNQTPTKKRVLGFWSAAAIGIGGMVGGGIFAVLGLSIQLAHGGTPIAFILAGIIALITTYSYVQLSITYPTQGGTVDFINQAFGSGIISSSLNILLCLSYVLMLSLYAYAFGSYGASFFSPAIHSLMKHFCITFIVILLTGINLMGAKVVGHTEIEFVSIKVAILILFIIMGIFHTDFQVLKPTNWSPPLELVAGGMIIFLAYEGFELIANSAQDVQNPKTVLKHAYYSAVVFVILLYVFIAIVTLGTLDMPAIIAARDYVLAASARPILGNLGFILIAIAALLATGSAINATLYGTSRIIHNLAKAKELPNILESKRTRQPVEGLLLLSFLTLIIANLFDLRSIATMGSAGFLIIFAAVNYANIKLHKLTNSYRFISFLGVVSCVLALVALFWKTLEVNPSDIFILLSIIGFSFIYSIIFRSCKCKHHSSQ